MKAKPSISINMMQLIYHRNKVLSAIFYSLIGFTLLLSCSAPLDTADPKKSFIKIYNDTTFNKAITAIDVVETETGYLILASNQIPDQQFPGITLISLDKEGKVVKETNLVSDYISAAKGIFKSGTNYRFLAMDKTTFFADLIEVDNNGSFIKNTSLSVTYPLSIGLASDGNYLVLGYSQSERASYFKKYDAVTLSETVSAKINILESADEQVFNDLGNTGKKFPFSVGETSTHYFFNGFYNFTFSLVFISKSSKERTGEVNGYRYSGGMNSITPLSGNNFAISRFYFGSNYINTNVTLNPTVASSSTNITGREMLELEPDANISASRMIINGKNVLIFASNTINKQVVLYVYDEVSGALINTRYFGLSIPLEHGSLTLTNDSGLLLVGSAYVNGRFKRISAIKLSESELNDLVK